MNANIQRLLNSVLLKPLILFLSPISISSPKTSHVGIRLLSCHRDIPLLIISLHSFYYYSRLDIPCQLIDDGSLTKQDIKLIQGKFPGIKVISYSSSRRITLKKLHRHPLCLKQRTADMPNNMHLKHFDLLINSPYVKTIFFDSDSLFFRCPNQINSWANNSKTICLYANQIKYPNYQVAGAHPCCNKVARILADKYHNYNLYYFNSGLLCFHKQAYNLNRIEEMLKYMFSVGLEKSWAARQFIISVLVSENPHQELDHRYVHLRTQAESKKTFKHGLSNYNFLHYSFTSRVSFYPAALILLFKTNFFSKTT